MTLGITSTTLNLLRTTPDTFQNGNDWTRSEVLQLIGRNGDEEDDNYYDDDYPLPHKKAKSQRTRRTNGSSNGDAWIDLVKNPTQLGVVLVVLGSLFTLIGMILFFEGNLLKIGNILIVGGAFLLFGPKKVSAFFMKESRLQAAIITSIGFLLLLWGKPKLGLLIEIFGLLNLFGNMFPMLIALGKNLPIIGDIIQSVENSFSNTPPPQHQSHRKQYNPNYQRENHSQQQQQHHPQW
eukprot:gene9606-10430_t